MKIMRQEAIELTPIELRQAYEEQQHIYDVSDIENELDMNAEYYAEKFNVDNSPVTEDEIERMACVLRKILNDNADAVWSYSTAEAVTRVLKERTECK